MGETIVLPRSGVVLTRVGDARDTDVFEAAGTDVRFNVRSCRADFFHRDCITGASRDEALAFLDSRVLALRAALADPEAERDRLPEDARERVAAAISDVRFSFLAGTLLPRPRTEGALSLVLADAALKALASARSAPGAVTG